MLHFNSDKFDYWKIYDSIKRFYPIGIPKDESKLYYSYPGIKELDSIVVDKIHNDIYFQKHWANYDRQIENKLQKPVVGTTYAQAPSFSSFVQLETFSFDNFIRSKELHFFVSLIGPYYTIVGQDTNALKIGAETFRSTNYLVVSPEKEYTEPFHTLCNQIESNFDNYRFVPSVILKQTIEGLEVRYTDDKESSVFAALFNNNIDLNIRTVGNKYFKSEDWIKEDYVDNGRQWTVYPPK